MAPGADYGANTQPNREGARVPKLVIVYGPPFSRSDEIAWLLARSLPEKTAVLSTSALLEGSIAVPGPDFEAELDMVHTQLRLLVANYLKNRYNVVVEGAFIHARDGALYNNEMEMDQLIALMRHLAPHALIVRINASPEQIAMRARAAGREEEAARALDVAAAYRDRYGLRFLSLDADSLADGEIVTTVRNELDRQEEAS